MYQSTLDVYKFQVYYYNQFYIIDIKKYKMSDVSYFSFQVNPVNPKPYLIELINRKISVKLKWGIDYQGILKSFDKYMNIHLDKTEEVINGVKKGFQLGDVLIRCNNILYIREVIEEENQLFYYKIIHIHGYFILDKIINSFFYY